MNAATPETTSDAPGISVWIRAVGVVIAGVLFVVFYALVGGGATFRQMFTVVTHAGVIVVAQQLFVVPLNYTRESMTNRRPWALFFPCWSPAASSRGSSVP